MLPKASSLAQVAEESVNLLALQMNRQQEFALFPTLTWSMLKILCLDVVLSLESRLCSVPPKV